MIFNLPVKYPCSKITKSYLTGTVGLDFELAYMIWIVVSNIKTFIPKFLSMLRFRMIILENLNITKIIYLFLSDSIENNIKTKQKN